MQLVVQSGAEPGRPYDLATSGKITVGRQSGNDLIVLDEGVSRRHAEIEARNGELVVIDLGSSNGTFVNDVQISSPQPLKLGDTVRIGSTVLLAAENASPVYATPIPPAYPVSNYPNYATAPLVLSGNPGQALVPPAQPIIYNQPPNPAPTTKRVFPLIPVTGGLVLVVIVVILLWVFGVFGPSDDSVIGELPVPPNSTQLTATSQALAKLKTGLDNMTPTQLNAGFYTTKETPVAVAAFYQNRMAQKGWTVAKVDNSISGTSGLELTKGPQIGFVLINTVTNQAQIDQLEGMLPSIKGQLHIGDTAVILLQTSKTFLTPSPSPYGTPTPG